MLPDFLQESTSLEAIIAACKRESLERLTDGNDLAQVFLTASGMEVIRIRKDDPAYEAFTKICQKFPDNPHLQSISESMYLDDGTHVTISDRLYPVTYGYYHDFRNFNNFIRGYHMNPDDMLPFAEDADFMTALREIYTVGLALNRADPTIHPLIDGNTKGFMTRENAPNQLIITDPLFRLTNNARFTFAATHPAVKATIFNAYARFGIEITPDMKTGNMPDFDYAPGNWPVHWRDDSEDGHVTYTGEPRHATSLPFTPFEKN